ncbi:MAG TPA: molybdopterin-dependent oxidoreductase [Polyangiaceae bacterium]|nr:molybdopterin-dependent oxidoreductase [Polyangiaceae bacterium]
MGEVTKHFTTCPLCEATCGVEIHVEGGAIRRIAGDEQDTFSRGFICPKGAALQQLHADPDRLRAPLVREPGGAFREVSWDEAFAHVERRLRPSMAGDPASAAVYLGNPNVHSIAGTLLPRHIVRALGTRNLFTASTVDQMPKHVACGLMYGDPGALTVPDIDRTDYLLMLGANPWESNGSLCTAPDFPGRIRDLLARGGRFVVVDPRRTRTAEHASEHVRIRPGSDVYFLLGLAHVVFREDRVRLGRLTDCLAGVDAAKEIVAPFTPSVVSRMTGIEATVVERLARELSERERGVVYSRIGTHTVSFGTLAAWAVDLLNAITGHLDTPGGAMWALPAHMARERGRNKERQGFAIGRWNSRAKGYPEVLSEFPVATLADEIETPGPGQVRVLVTIAGNPALSAPDSARLERALARLSFMVSVDPYLNETTRHAHVILPPPSPLTRSHYDISLSRLAVRNRARWSPPLFTTTSPSEAEILARLALVIAGRGALADPRLVYEQTERHLITTAIANTPALANRTPEDIAAALVARDPLDRFVEIMIRAGAYGDAFGASGGLSLERLRENPHGIDLGPLEPALPGMLKTKSGKVELLPEPIRDDMARLTATLEESHSVPKFVLIGRRDLRSNNSWMHNIPLLIKGKPRCTLQIHPDDAASMSVLNGGLVRVQSSVGQVLAPAEITEKVMRGVVSLPHGYGHDRPGTRQRVAAENAGVNVNLLTDARVVDPLSGNAVLNGIPVTLTPL